MLARSKCLVMRRRAASPVWQCPPGQAPADGGSSKEADVFVKDGRTARGPPPRGPAREERADEGHSALISQTVLDATAVLALLHDEPGEERVASLLPTAVISTVNLAEVAGKLAESWIPERAVKTVVGELGLQVIPFDEALAFRAGLLRPATSDYGLSLGDRACLTLGQHLRKPVLTADRMWKTLKLDAVVGLIR